MSGRLHQHRGGIAADQALLASADQAILRPFSPFAPLPPWGASLALGGGLLCQDGKLTVVFHLHGDLGNLDLPTCRKAGAPARSQQLWHRSCFEVFLARSDQEQCCEVNLCPDGCWNIYRFTGYRCGMSEPPQASARLAVAAGEKTLTLAATLALPAEFGCRPPIRAGLCAVLLHRDRTRSYWALTHPGSQPDFHDRRGFLYSLEVPKPTSMGLS